MEFLGSNGVAVLSVDVDPSELCSMWDSDSFAEDQARSNLLTDVAVLL